MSRPPFTPPDTFRCAICFELVHVDDAWTDITGQRWDMCRPCGQREAFAVPVPVDGLWLFARLLDAYRSGLIADLVDGGS